MHGVLPLWDFLVAMVCMSPPLDQVALPTLPTFLIPSVFMTSIITLMMALLSGPHGVGPGLICIPIIGVIALAIYVSGADISSFKTVFFASYPPMVFSMRFVEGVMVGAILPRKFLLLQVGGLITLPFISYAMLLNYGREHFIWLLIIWGAIGIVLASIRWSLMLAGSVNSPFNSPLAFIALIGIFTATLFYISTSRIEQAIYNWAFPFGFVISCVPRKAKNRQAGR